MHRRPSTNVTKFTAIAVNGFYTMTRSGLMTTADSDSPENIQCDELRTLAADEKAMKELYAQAEVLQTATQPKRLVVYKEYLLWFRDLPTNDEPRVPDSASTPHKGTLGAEALTSCSTSKASSPKRNTPVLEGYANIRGMYVESNHSTKILRSEKSVTSIQQPPRMRGLIKPMLATETSNKETRQSIFWLRLMKVPDSLIQEGLFFKSTLMLEKWRQAISKSPVFFMDLHLRYELQEGSSIALAHQDLKQYQVDSKKRYNTRDPKEFEELCASFLQQTQVMLRLSQTKLDPGFQELHLQPNAFHLVRSRPQGGTIADWIKEFVFLEEITNESDRLSALVQIFLLIAHSLLILVEEGITYSISKQSVLMHTVLFSKHWPQTLEHWVKHGGKPSDGLQGFGSDECLIVQPTSLVLLGEFSNSYLDHNSSKANHKQQPQSTSQKLQRWARNIQVLGEIFFELSFGICLSTACCRPQTPEGEYARNMLDKPDRYIKQRVGICPLPAKLENLLARMLNPNWKCKPTLFEVVQILQSLLGEHYKGESLYLLPVTDHELSLGHIKEILTNEAVTVRGEATMQQATLQNLLRSPALDSRDSSRGLKTRGVASNLGSRLGASPKLSAADGIVEIVTLNAHQNLANKVLARICNNITLADTRTKVVDQLSATLRPRSQLLRVKSNSLTLAKQKDLTANTSATSLRQVCVAGSDPKQAADKIQLSHEPEQSFVSEHRNSLLLRQVNRQSGQGLLNTSRSNSPVPTVCLEGRRQFSPENKLKKVVLANGAKLMSNKLSPASRSSSSNLLTYGRLKADKPVESPVWTEMSPVLGQFKPQMHPTNWFSSLVQHHPGVHSKIYQQVNISSTAEPPSQTRSHLKSLTGEGGVGHAKMLTLKRVHKHKPPDARKSLLDSLARPV